MSDLYRVLVVDDDPADLYLYEISLASSIGGDVHFEHIEVTSGQAGIESVGKYRPDCIVLDHNLPDMDGLEFMAAITGETGELPCALVMLTGVQDERVAVQAMKSGAIDYIRKTDLICEILPQAITSAVAKFRMLRKIEQQRIALEASERKYRSLMENTPQLVWLADQGGTAHYGNRRWSEYTGMAVTLENRVNLNEAICPSDRELFWGTWRDAMESGVGFEIEVRLRRGSDHTYRWHLVDVRPMRDFLGAGSQLLGTCTDIEKNKQAERVLQETKKWESIGLLAGGIAHDFNNLLVGILGGASFMGEVMSPTDALRPILDAIMRSGQRAAQLTQQMLAYSGKGPFFLSPVDLSAAVRDARPLLNASIGENVELTIEAPETLPAIETDPNQILHVITNLIVNAAESIAEGKAGKIVVRTYLRCADGKERLTDSAEGGTPSASHIVLEVQDTGTGMDSETISKVFDPFFSTKFTGRGLGLAAVQGIVRSSRGSIEIESEMGKGSMFRVIFPVCPIPTLTKEEAEGNGFDRKLRQSVRQKVLVIEDEDVVREILRLALERAGCHVVLAGGGEEGLRLLKEDRAGFDLVILDLGMPELGGKEVLLAMRAHGMDVPVVVCSGHGEPEVLSEIRGFKIAEFIQKPFSITDVSKRVLDVLKSAANNSTTDEPTAVFPGIAATV